MEMAFAIRSPNGNPRAILTTGPTQVGLVAELEPGGWRAIAVVTTEGDVRSVPPCFSFTNEALEMLNEILQSGEVF